MPTRFTVIVIERLHAILHWLGADSIAGSVQSVSRLKFSQ